MNRLFFTVAVAASVSTVAAPSAASPQEEVESPTRGSMAKAGTTKWRLDRAIAHQRLLLVTLQAHGPPVAAVIYLIASGIEQLAQRGLAEAKHQDQLAQLLHLQTSTVLYLVTGAPAPWIPPLFEERLSVAGVLARTRCVLTQDLQSCAHQLAEAILSRLESMR